MPDTVKRQVADYEVTIELREGDHGWYGWVTDCPEGCGRVLTRIPRAGRKEAIEFAASVFENHAKNNREHRRAVNHRLEKSRGKRRK